MLLEIFIPTLECLFCAVRTKRGGSPWSSPDFVCTFLTFFILQIAAHPAASYSAEMTMPFPVPSDGTGQLKKYVSDSATVLSSAALEPEPESESRAE